MSMMAPGPKPESLMSYALRHVERYGNDNVAAELRDAIAMNPYAPEETSDTHSAHVWYRLIRLFERAGFSREEIGQVLGVFPCTVRDWLNGRCMPMSVRIRRQFFEKLSGALELRLNPRNLAAE